MTESLLTLDGVMAGYGPLICLHEICLFVNPGEIVALIGANGAGKTTTLMTISGLIRPKRGAIRFHRARLDHLPPEGIVALGVSHVPEGRRIFPRLTVLDNLELGGYLRQDPRGLQHDLERVWTLFPILAERRRQLAGTLSGGEQQMLAIGRGLMARPKLLLLDEPSLGLAPKLVVTIFEVIKQINEAGMAILLVEQNAHMALGIAHRGYVLEAGRIVLADSALALAANPRVKAAYLGG